MSDEVDWIHDKKSEIWWRYKGDGYRFVEFRFFPDGQSFFAKHKRMWYWAATDSEGKQIGPKRDLKPNGEYTPYETWRQIAADSQVELPSGLI